MKLSKRVTRKSDSQLVHRINELYHNLEGGCYDCRHDDIPHFDQAFWEKKAQEYLVKASPLVCLDYGTGTGFVPLVIGPYLKEQDCLICCDLSTEMLKVCEDKIKASPLCCECSFRKIDGPEIPIDNNSVDVITVNSVLHHIYDLGPFAKECERILKPGGILIVAHEPNKNTRLPFPGNALCVLATLIARPKSVFFRIAERIPLAESLMRRIVSKISKSYRRRNKMLGEIARRLREENLLDFDLRGTEIQQIIDFHTQYGFDAQELFQNIFTGFEPVEFETFNHLGFSTGGKWAQRIDGYIKKNWPNAGKGIRFVLKYTSAT